MAKRGVAKRRARRESVLTAVTVVAGVFYVCISGSVFRCISGIYGDLAWLLVLPGVFAALVAAVFALAWRSADVFSPRQRRFWTLAVCIAVVGWPISWASSCFFNHASEGGLRGLLGP